METISDLALEGRRTRPAVYCIENIHSGRRLIASTINLSKRMYDQMRWLNKGEHYNSNLHADLIVAGPDVFRVVVLELLDDVRTLAQLKRLHVEHARQTTGGCYNPEPPVTRSKLVIDHETAKAVAEQRQRTAAKSLDDAIDHMPITTRRQLDDQMIANWKQNAGRSQR